MNDSASNVEGGWTREITPHHRLFDLKLEQIWKHRDLIYLFVRRNFVATYKQTVLGPLWFLIQPLLTTLVFTVVFKKIAKIPTDGLPPTLFFMAGILAWGYFADCLIKTSSTFSQNAAIFGKVYFPRLVVPISTVIGNLITFGIQFLLFAGFYLYFWLQEGSKINPTYRVIVLPVLMIQMAMLGIGIGCLVSSLTTRYRDLSMLVGFGVQLWMYGSCVAFPLSQVPKEWRWALVLNPMVPIIESFRFAFLGRGVVEIWQLAVGGTVSLVIFLVGIVVFNHVERTFADTI
jgi:lipopolysaccharide transport system permease protein